MDWNEKYLGKDYFYGTEPNDFLHAIANTWATPKKILCIAEGEGRNAVFLARLGHQVSAIDSSSVAREKALALAEANNLQIDYQLADLNEFDFGTEQWDAIVSIFCHLPAALRQKVHQDVEAGLVTGGLFLLEAYSPRQLKYTSGGPKDLGLLYELDSLKKDFKTMLWQQNQEIIRTIQEGTGHSGPSSVVQLLGQKQ
ncbi:class I SAM-dependent methyltransferase [Thiomicrospira cyclica]|uniref:Methyltransferase type 11 n=1 Tax=Thiomicrospira cyclica (strain DSM 14477 / JCM 11371 / ALM1) TaxID=717773 RepID=F6DC00_THICA|nr:class I SAM-dependent methyltransferase [Thiomicrospira cyclica]AEG31386.1 Methyltransferase type 11 [Thiomicrospira cyclica ALM1]